MHNKPRYLIVLLIGLSLALTVSCNKATETTEELEKEYVKRHHYVIVVDTSLSMNRLGNYKSGSFIKKRTTYADALSNIRCFIYSIKEDDKVTLVTFDVGVVDHETITIETRNDRNRVMDILTNNTPKGQWTNTYAILQHLSTLYKTLRDDNPGEKIVAIILSDGLDDPPPAFKTKRISLKEFAGQFQGLSNIYYINWNKKKYDEVAGKIPAKDSLGEAIPDINTKYTDLNKIRTDEEAGTASKNLKFILIALAVLLILFLIIFFIVRAYRQAKNRPLPWMVLYWEAQKVKGQKTILKGKELNSNTFLVGSSNDATIRINSYPPVKDVFISAYKMKDGALRWMIHEPMPSNVELKGVNPAEIKPGETIVVGILKLEFRLDEETQ